MPVDGWRLGSKNMEQRGVEPLASDMRNKRSTNGATVPFNLPPFQFHFQSILQTFLPDKNNKSIYKRPITAYVCCFPAFLTQITRRGSTWVRRGSISTEEAAMNCLLCFCGRGDGYLKLGRYL